MTTKIEYYMSEMKTGTKLCAS